jgi:hypothetical protein
MSILSVNLTPINNMLLLCQYDLLPDANTANRNQEDIPFQQTQYGQLLDIYYVQLHEDISKTGKILEVLFQRDLSHEAGLKIYQEVKHFKALFVRPHASK